VGGALGVKSAIYSCRVQNVNYEELFDVIDELILGVYMTDILLKWYCNFALFWKNGWNIFDLGVVALMLLGVGKFLLSNSGIVTHCKAICTRRLKIQQNSCCNNIINLLCSI